MILPTKKSVIYKLFDIASDADAKMPEALYN